VRLGKKKLAAVAVSAIAILGASVGAYAYFTGGSASDTKSAAVGSTTTWTVAVSSFTGAVYPGAGSGAATYTVTNTGTGAQALTGVTAALAQDGSGNIKQANVALAGCLASWFTATAGTPTPAAGVSIAPAGTATGSVTLTMADSGTNQNVCKGATPDVTVTAS
jgi:hypothetical protein